MQSNKQRWPALLSVVVAFGLLAAACGDDNNDSTGSGSEAASGNAQDDCSGEITGSGASFPDVFYQEVITQYADVNPDLTVSYNAIGSGSGKEEFGQNLNDFAGSDSLVEPGDGPEEGSFLYVPTTASAVTISFNLPGVDELNLTPDNVAQIFQREITTWNDPAIAENNPDADLPDSEIIVAHRADGSGTTNNFTKYLESAAPDTWTLGSGDEVEWPADTQAGQQNTGVAQIVSDNEGAIGYVDLGDAEEIGLTFAAIQNKDGNFVAPSVDGVQAALAGAEVADDLTYDPRNAAGEDTYPITAGTYILVRTDYSADTAAAVKCFVTYLLTDGSDLAPDVGFAPLPSELRDQALAQLDNL